MNINNDRGKMKRMLDCAAEVLAKNADCPSPQPEDCWKISCKACWIQWLEDNA